MATQEQVLKYMFRANVLSTEAMNNRKGVISMVAKKMKAKAPMPKSKVLKKTKLAGDVNNAGSGKKKTMAKKK